MVTNEELARLAQAGDGEALLKLWTQVKRMVYKMALRWAVAGRGGATVEDLCQSAFIALMLAVDSYDPTRAKFSTWFWKYLQREFAVATGQQSKQAELDALQSSISIDAPLTADDGDPFTLADTIEDPAAEAEIESTGIRLAVEEALSGLPENQRRAVRDKYWRGLPVDSKTHAAALRYLRHPARSRQLVAYL